MTRESQRKLDIHAARELVSKNFFNNAICWLDTLSLNIFVLLKQVIFNILDHLQRWLRERRLFQDGRYEAIKSAVSFIIYYFHFYVNRAYKMIDHFINIFRVLWYVRQFGSGRRLLSIAGISSSTNVSRTTYGF